MYFSGISDEAGSSIEAQIRAHQELGWTDMEIRTVNSINLTDVSDQKFEEIYEKVTEADMTVSSFGSQLCNWARPITTDFEIDLHELKRAVPRMQKFGTKYIRIMSYPNDENKPWTEDEWRDEVIRRISELAKIAEHGDVILAHENCSGWAGLSPENSLVLLEKVKSPALKLIFDTGNTVAYGQDSMEFFTKVKEHVVHVHIKDGVKTEQDIVFKYPGEGDGMVPEVVAELKKDGFEGAVSIEPHLKSIIHEGKGADDPESAHKAYIKYGRMLMDIAGAS